MNFIQKALCLLCVLISRMTNQAIATTPAPGLIGDPCTGGSGACTLHAKCNGTNCVCDANYSTKKPSLTCGANVGHTCINLNDCIDNAKCEPPATSVIPTQPVTVAPPGRKRDTPRTCQCEDNYFSDGNICKQRLPPDAVCVDGQCTANAFCSNDTVKRCTCNAGYYKNDSQHCSSRILPGQPCVLTAGGDNNCVIGASCYTNNTCQCIVYQYKLNAAGNDCIKIKQDGENCTDTSECGENAICSTTSTPNKCQCNPDFFYNTNDKHCQLRKPLGAPCSATTECVDHAVCNPSICVCNDNYYYHNQRCNHRLQLNHPCDSAIPRQCLNNGECVNGFCQCNQNSYSDGIECRQTLPFDAACDLEVSDPRQCFSNTTCGFQSGTPKCGCDINHFFNGQYCVKRALVGDSCPYVSVTSVGLVVPDAEFQRQCVENAFCDNIFEVCECKPGFYDRGGRCPKQIDHDQICDPWTDSPNQCIDNYQCLYGRCVPRH